MPIQTYQRRPREAVKVQRQARRSPEGDHRIYHRRSAENLTITYRRRLGGALEQYEEMLDEELDFHGRPQNVTYQRRPRYQRNRRELSNENDFEEAQHRYYNEGQG